MKDPTCPRCRTLRLEMNQPPDCDCGHLRRQSPLTYMSDVAVGVDFGLKNDATAIVPTRP